MSRLVRATVWIGGALLLVVALALWMTLEALDARLVPPCLDRVAPPPEAAAVRVEAVGEDRLRVHAGGGLVLDVPRGPRRIVSGLPGVTEAIAYLGGLDRLVGVSRWCDHPAAVRSLPKVSVQPFDAEAVLALAPDVVVLDRRLHRRDLPAVRRRGLPVLVLDTSRSLAHLEASLDVLARVLDTPEAHARAEAFRARRAALEAAVLSGRPARPPRVLVVGQWDPLYAIGRGALLDDLLRLCGCVNVACDLAADASGPFQEELVLARRPDWILAPREPLPATLATRWARVPAVRDGRVADASADDLVRAGPRILDGLERLAAVLRGERPPQALRGAP